MPGLVFKTSEGSGNRLLVGSIPMRSRQLTVKTCVKVNQNRPRERVRMLLTPYRLFGLPRSGHQQDRHGVEHSLVWLLTTAGRYALPFVLQPGESVALAQLFLLGGWRSSASRECEPPPVHAERFWTKMPRLFGHRWQRRSASARIVATAVCQRMGSSSALTCSAIRLANCGEKLDVAFIGFPLFSPESCYKS